jgi:hypothetical protein
MSAASRRRPAPLGTCGIRQELVQKHWFASDGWVPLASGREQEAFAYSGKESDAACVLRISEVCRYGVLSHWTVASQS